MQVLVKRNIRIPSNDFGVRIKKYLQCQKILSEDIATKVFVICRLFRPLQQYCYVLCCVISIVLKKPNIALDLILPNETTDRALQ